MIKARWFLYTIIIGLLPLLIRMMIYFLFRNVKEVYIINEVDIVTFGLVLHLSNINELEGRNKGEKLWRTWNTGISKVMLIILSALLSLAYISDFLPNTAIDKSAIKIMSGILGIASLIFSYSIFHRLNKLYS